MYIRVYVNTLFICTTAILVYSFLGAAQVCVVTICLFVVVVVLALIKCNTANITKHFSKTKI